MWYGLGLQGRLLCACMRLKQEFYPGNLGCLVLQMTITAKNVVQTADCW